MKILVMHPWGIGDLIMATPMMRSLSLSGHRVDLALSSSDQEAIVRKAPFLHKVYIAPKPWQWLRFFGRYDALVVTAGANPNKARKLQKILAIPRLFASSQIPDLHRIDVNLKMVAPLLSREERVPYIYSSWQKEQTVLQRIGYAPGSGSRQAFKRWGAEKFARLAERLGREAWIFLGPDEAELLPVFEGRGFRVVHGLSLEETIAAISRMELMVGNDNGLMHIAYGLGKKTVTIYGMTNEKETGGYGPKNRAVSLALPCRPCFDPATDRISCDTLDCLRDLTVEEVEWICRESLL
jgi:ADP-heptose:LPS heptosyltransferase